MTWIRARFARIHRAVDCAGWLEAYADQLVTGIGLHRLSLVTRQRRRVTRQICRLAGVLVIAFARNQVGRRAEFLRESLSISWIAIVNEAQQVRGLRAASRPTNG